MLAKLWKKVLLAVCIIACIFNVMSKLVNRNSLEVNLKSANDGNTVFDFTRKDSEPASPGIIQEVKEVLEERKKQNTTQENETILEDTNSSVIESNENGQMQENEQDVENNQPTESEEEPKEENNKAITYKDYTFVELF